MVYDIKCPNCEKELSLINPTFVEYLCGCGRLFHWRVTIQKPFKKIKTVTEVQRARVRQYMAVYSKRPENRQKVLARRMVYVAKRSGRLKQLPCLFCGDTKVQAHHEDYSKPLDVVWLCKLHHQEADQTRVSVEKGVNI